MKDYFECFIDIYENVTVNQEIYQRLVTLNLEKTNLSDYEQKLQIAIMLPYTSQILKDLSNDQSSCSNETQLSEAESTISPLALNTKNAITYATTYADSPNTPSYKYWENMDCTNFASQILTAGGLYHTLSWNYTRGHNGVHTWTHAWSYANEFFDYFAAKNSSSQTKDHYAFSVGISAGDFIAFDKAGDSGWDHIGFVTEADTYAATYGGKYYYDYRVAQHSDNYNRWTSKSDNYWDDKPSTCIYGRLVINKS